MTIERQYIKQLNEGKKSKVLSDEEYIKRLKSYMHNNPNFQELWNMLPMINDDLKDDGIKTLTDSKLKKYYNMIQQKKNESIESDFSAEVAKRNFNDICKQLSQIFGGITIEADPRNFLALKDCVNLLEIAARANLEGNTKLLVQSIKRAQEELDRDRN